MALHLDLELIDFHGCKIAWDAERALWQPVIWPTPHPDEHGTVRCADGDQVTVTPLRPEAQA